MPLPNRRRDSWGCQEITLHNDGSGGSGRSAVALPHQHFGTAAGPARSLRAPDAAAQNPAECSTHPPAGDTASSLRLSLFPGKEMAVQFRLLATRWPCSAPCISSASIPGSAGQERSRWSSAASACSCRVPSSPSPPPLLLLTPERDFSLGHPPRQPPRFCTKQKRELGNYLP